MHEISCPICEGTRLKKIRNYTLLAGKNYAQLGKMEFFELHSFLDLISEKNDSMEIISILKECAHEMKKCVVIVTHSNENAKQADVILRLKEGQLFQI